MLQNSITVDTEETAVSFVCLKNHMETNENKNRLHLKVSGTNVLIHFSIAFDTFF